MPCGGVLAAELTSRFDDLDNKDRETAIIIWEYFGATLRRHQPLNDAAIRQVGRSGGYVATRFPVLCAVGIFASLAATSLLAANDKTALDSITVEAQRDHDALEKQVDSFVSGAMVHYSDVSPGRWDRPVCPLVAGLPQEQAEFVLARVSQITAAAGAPLGHPQCKPANLYIIVTAEPERFLKKWRSRDVRLFDDTYGELAIRRFLDTPRAIRVWYNTAAGDLDGALLPLDGLPGRAGGRGAAGLSISVPTSTLMHGSRLIWPMLEAFSSVIIIADATRIEGLTFEQIAAYVAMAGLAHVRPDSDVGTTPSILQLFSAAADRSPQFLSEWDTAFLKALYNTQRTSALQLLMIKTSMMQSIAH